MKGRRLSYTEQEARDAVAASKSWAESLRRLGLCPTGGAWRILKKYAHEWQISTEHFDPRAVCGANLKRRARPLSEALVAGSTYGRQHVKRRLLAEGLKEPRCEMCGQGEIWQGKPMSMILDHINGVRDDHRLENHCKKEFVPSTPSSVIAHGPVASAGIDPVAATGQTVAAGGCLSPRRAKSSGRRTSN